MIDIQLFQRDSETLLLCTLKGELTRQEYSVFLPSFESEIRHFSGLRIFFDLTEFEGWCSGSLWRKLSFNSRHRTHLEKIAIVGVIGKTKWIESACRPLRYDKIRRFAPHHIEAAWNWIGE